MFVKLANFCLFLPNLPTFGRFNQNGVLDGERGYDEPSFGAIRKKFISRFLRKFGLSPELGHFFCFLPINRAKMIQSKIRKKRLEILAYIIISQNYKKIHQAVFELQ